MSSSDLWFDISMRLKDLRESYEDGKKEFALDEFFKELKDIEAPIDEECTKIMQSRVDRHLAKEAKYGVRR